METIRSWWKAVAAYFLSWGSLFRRKNANENFKILGFFAIFSVFVIVSIEIGLLVVTTLPFYGGAKFNIILGSTFYFSILVFGFLFVYFKLGEQIWEAIKLLRLFGIWFLIRLILVFVLPNGLTRLVSSQGGFLKLSDVRLYHESRDEYGGSGYSDLVGSLNIVVNKDISDGEISIINGKLEKEGSDIFIKRRGNEFFAVTTANYEGGAFRSTPYLFWQTAVCDGADFEPAITESRDASFLDCFRISPFALIELLLNEIPVSLLSALLAWSFRGYIIPLGFPESEKKRVERIRKAELRIHLLEGYLVGLENLEDVLETILESTSKSRLIEDLMIELELTDLQARSLLEVPLIGLTKFEHSKVEEELEELEHYVKSSKKPWDKNP